MEAIIKIEKGGNIGLAINDVPKDKKERETVWQRIHFLGKVKKVYPFCNLNTETCIQVEFWGSSLTPEYNVTSVKEICREIGIKEIIEVQPYFSN